MNFHSFLVTFKLVHFGFECLRGFHYELFDRLPFKDSEELSVVIYNISSTSTLNCLGQMSFTITFNSVIFQMTCETVRQSKFRKSFCFEFSEKVQFNTESCFRFGCRSKYLIEFL